MTEAVCVCIACGHVMRNLMDEDQGLQPSGGLAFETRGHYGSSYFDPIGDLGGNLLEIAVCDNCLEGAEERGHVFRGMRTTRTQTKRVKRAKPKKDLDEPPADT